MQSHLPLGKTERKVNNTQDAIAQKLLEEIIPIIRPASLSSHCNTHK